MVCWRKVCLSTELTGDPSSFSADDCNNGLDIVFPFIVGVLPGVSEDEPEDDCESWPEDEVKVFFTGPEAISFLAIVLVSCESTLGGGSEDAVESVDGLESVSSLILSCDSRGVEAFSAERSPLLDVDLDMLVNESLRF